MEQYGVLEFCGVAGKGVGYGEFVGSGAIELNGVVETWLAVGWLAA